MKFEYLLEDFPEWAIPMTEVVPIFYTENAYTLDDGTLTVMWDYRWEIVDNTNVKIHIDITVARFTDVVDSAIFLPLYMDLKLYFVNRNQYNEIYEYQK